ncbi:MAG TPA: hypothetical protein VND92_04410 [Vicinamibacterales bacterium]|nr:hypothetical protein [Vicinamibacterales bacterium]
MITNLEARPAPPDATAPDAPRPGDVVVKTLSESPFLFGLGVYPCALQQPCGMYEQAERHGRALARRFGVDVWREEDGLFVRLDACRGDG